MLFRSLLYLREKYFKKLEISDEGGYYPKKNVETLKQRMGFIDNAIATLHDVFEHAEFSENPEEMMEQMREAISRSLKDVKVEVIKIELGKPPKDLFKASENDD